MSVSSGPCHHQFQQTHSYLMLLGCLGHSWGCIMWHTFADWQQLWSGLCLCGSCLGMQGEAVSAGKAVVKLQP